MRESVTSTNVFVHVEATRRRRASACCRASWPTATTTWSACWPTSVAIRLTYWLVTRAETLRRPEVAAVVDAITTLHGRPARRSPRRGASVDRACPSSSTNAARAYYRHWAAAEPRAAVIFLHGFGEHTGAVPPVRVRTQRRGHRPVGGRPVRPRPEPGRRAATSAPRGQLGAGRQPRPSWPSSEHPGIPLVAQGHSFGAVVTLFRLLDRPGPLPRGGRLRRAAGPGPRTARRRHLVRARPGLAVCRPVLPGLDGERSAGVRRRRRRGHWPGNWTEAGTGSAPNCRRWRCRRSPCTASTTRSHRSARCAPTPSRSNRCRSRSSPAAATTSSTRSTHREVAAAIVGVHRRAP